MNSVPTVGSMVAGVDRRCEGALLPAAASARRTLSATRDPDHSHDPRTREPSGTVVTFAHRRLRSLVHEAACDSPLFRMIVLLW